MNSLAAGFEVSKEIVVTLACEGRRCKSYEHRVRRAITPAHWAKRLHSGRREGRRCRETRGCWETPLLLGREDLLG